MGKITGFLELAPILLAGLACALTVEPALTGPALARAYPPNVYFHFTDGHGGDFRVPQAVFMRSAADCTNPAKLAALARALQKQVPLYAGWTYVKAECRAPTPLGIGRK